MEFTTLTIIIMCVVLFFGIVTPLINPFLRLPRKQEDLEEPVETEDSEEPVETKDLEEPEEKEGSEKTVLPPVSVVILAHDNGPQLRNSLEIFLNQDFPADYEVIVVADKDDSETDDVIKLYSGYERLYATFMPKSSRYLSRRKLGITLGIKAAHHEWVVVTNGYCKPANNQWLRTFASQLTDDREVILGHTYYDQHAPKYYQFEHLRKQLYYLRCADKGSPVSTMTPLLAIKKKLFIDNDGFRGNLKFVRGEFAFIVNKYANGENCAISIAHNAQLIEATPYKRRWKNKHLYQININPSLQHNTFVNILSRTDMYSMHLCNILCTVALVYGIIFSNWLVCIAVGVAWIIELILRTVIVRRAFKRFQLDINCLATPFFEARLILNNIRWKLKYLFADENDFITHKV